MSKSAKSGNPYFRRDHTLRMSIKSRNLRIISKSHICLSLSAISKIICIKSIFQMSNFSMNASGSSARIETSSLSPEQSCFIARGHTSQTTGSIYNHFTIDGRPCEITIPIPAHSTAHLDTSAGDIRITNTGTTLCRESTARISVVAIAQYANHPAAIPLQKYLRYLRQKKSSHFYSAPCMWGLGPHPSQSPNHDPRPS